MIRIVFYQRPLYNLHARTAGTPVGYHRLRGR